MMCSACSTENDSDTDITAPSVPEMVSTLVITVDCKPCFRLDSEDSSFIWSQFGIRQCADQIIFGSWLLRVTVWLPVF